MVAAESNAGENRRTPVHLWIVGVLALLWNLMGAFNYLATQLRLEALMANMTPEQLAYLEAIPAWATSGWAVAVWFALAGSVGLLLRKCWSMWAFGISIVGMAVSSFYNYFIANGLELMGPGQVVLTLVIWAIAIALFVYARTMCSTGVFS